MGSKRNRPKVKYVQPCYRHKAPAAPPTAQEKAARLGPSQVLEKITRARIHQDELEQELAALVNHAVTLGISWPAIARHLGVTRQAARQHYQRRHHGQTTREDHAA
jgi:hypothetical protein